MTKYIEKKIELGEKILFNWMDRGRYGWAYFDVCQVWKRGRIKKIYIVPRQQESNVILIYETPKDFKATSFGVRSYGCKGEAKIGGVSYCKIHKAINLSMAVPEESEYFSLSLHFGNEISVEYQKEKK